VAVSDKQSISRLMVIISDYILLEHCYYSRLDYKMCMMEGKAYPLSLSLNLDLKADKKYSKAKIINAINFTVQLTN